MVLQVEGENFALAFAFYFFVETLAGFVAQPFAAGHFFDEFAGLCTFRGIRRSSRFRKCF